MGGYGQSGLDLIWTSQSKVDFDIALTAAVTFPLNKLLDVVAFGALLWGI